MKISKVNLVYFSATGTTQKVANAIAQGIGAPNVQTFDFTLPQNRKTAPTFESEDFVIVGMPVYVGRVPLVLKDYISSLKGNNTPCVLLAVYGNRHYDSFLTELEDMLIANGFVPVAAGAFVGEHSFTDKLASGRPNADDLAIANKFGQDIAAKMANAAQAEPMPIGTVPGDRPYKEPFAAGAPSAPTVNDACIDCKACAENCPMGAINCDNVCEINPNLCIKCRRCARICPTKAIEFDAQGMLMKHAAILVQNYGSTQRPAEIYL